MAKESPSGILLIISGSVGLHYFLFVLNAALCSISVLITYKFTIFQFTSTSCVDFILCYVERCQMFSGDL